MKNETKGRQVVPVFVFVPSMIVSSAGAHARSETKGRSTIDYASVLELLRERLPEILANAEIPGVGVAQIDGETLVWRNLAWTPFIRPDLPAD